MVYKKQKDIFCHVNKEVRLQKVSILTKFVT